MADELVEAIRGGRLCAVHQAASRGNARIMRAVLDAGGDLGRRDKLMPLMPVAAHWATH